MLGLTPKQSFNNEAFTLLYPIYLLLHLLIGHHLVQNGAKYFHKAMCPFNFTP
jgi:hypothetical protein